MSNQIATGTKICLDVALHGALQSQDRPSYLPSTSEEVKDFKPDAWVVNAVALAFMAGATKQFVRGDIVFGTEEAGGIGLLISTGADLRPAIYALEDSASYG